MQTPPTQDRPGSVFARIRSHLLPTTVLMDPTVLHCSLGGTLAAPILPTVPVVPIVIVGLPSVREPLRPGQASRDLRLGAFGNQAHVDDVIVAREVHEHGYHAL